MAIATDVVGPAHRTAGPTGRSCCGPGRRCSCCWSDRSSPGCPALVNARGVNSDAAVVGLQAMHILHGEWSWFLWGAGYQASFDAALVAAAFAVTGPSALTLMAVPLIGHLILVGLAYDVLRRAVGRGSAAIACLPLVFAPQSINGVVLYAPRQWSITAVVLAVWLAARAGGAGRPFWLTGRGSSPASRSTSTCSRCR